MAGTVPFYRSWQSPFVKSTLKGRNHDVTWLNHRNATVPSLGAYAKFLV